MNRNRLIELCIENMCENAERIQQITNQIESINAMLYQIAISLINEEAHEEEDYEEAGQYIIDHQVFQPPLKHPIMKIIVDPTKQLNINSMLNDLFNEKEGED